VFFRGRDEKGLCVRRAPVSAQCGALESPRRAPARRGVTGHTPEPAWAFARGPRARIRRTPASTDRTASAFGSALGGKRGIAESTNARSPSGWFGKKIFRRHFFTRFSRTRGRNLLLTLSRFLPSSGRPLQIRRSSYHDVVRVRDVCRLFDARNIQTYVINGARVVFLNERPHPRGKHGAGATQTRDEKKTSASSSAAGARRSSCRKCSRTLQSDTSRYCSIACKAGVAGAAMEPSEEAAREAEAESGGAEASARAKSAGEKSEKREKSGGRAAAAAAKRKKREMEDVDAERGGFGGFVENGSPRTPSALGSARGGRGAIGSNGSFGSVRGAKREPDGVGEDKPIFSLETLETTSAGGAREKDAPSFPLDSPFHKPGKEKRAKRETASPLGFPDLDNEGGGASGEVQTRGGVSNAGFKKKPALHKEKKEPTKPLAVISVSRRKNRPKRSPDA
jgi:hypothetical protein